MAKDCKSSYPYRVVGLTGDYETIKEEISEISGPSLSQTPVNHDQQPGRGYLGWEVKW
jgi:hypothetical protein